MQPADPISRLFRRISGPTAALRRGAGGEAIDHEAIQELSDWLRRLANGEIAERDSDHDSMLLGVITFRDTLAREVMTPRCDVEALPATATRAEALALMVEAGHSRVPVYDGSLDEIVGILLLKDLVAATLLAGNGVAAGQGERPLQSLLREPFYIPGTKRVGELLGELRAHTVHMAVVLDEFGGTEGIVTLEDLLEEIVGDIFDEHDEPEIEFDVQDDGSVIIDGGVSIGEVNERFDVGLPEEDFDTVGGFVFGSLGRVPVVGDVVPLDGGGELRVESVEERRITEVRYAPAATAREGDAAAS
jgi:putative hemolysin